MQNAFEFKSNLKIGKFTKAVNELYDYTLTINDDTYYFVNHNWVGAPKEFKWSLIAEDGSENYCFAESRKQVLADLLTSLYLDYKINAQ